MEVSDVRRRNPQRAKQLVAGEARCPARRCKGFALVCFHRMGLP